MLEISHRVVANTSEAATLTYWPPHSLGHKESLRVDGRYDFGTTKLM